MLRSLVKRWPPVYRRALAIREPVYRRRQVHRVNAYPPARVKLAAIREAQRRFGLRILVETGTYTGETAWAVRRYFDLVETVELDPDLFRLAQARFARTPRVHVHCGDSASVLPGILAELREPALFWLDAHVSTTRSARGTLASPAREELELILAHPVPGHVILVDDARLLTGEDGWPSVEELRALVAAKSGLTFEVADDIVRVFPASTG